MPPASCATAQDRGNDRQCPRLPGSLRETHNASQTSYGGFSTAARSSTNAKSPRDDVPAQTDLVERDLQSPEEAKASASSARRRCTRSCRRVGMVNDHLVTLPAPCRLRQTPERLSPCSREHCRMSMSGARIRDSSRAWQRMLSGRRLDLLNPSPMLISKLSISPTVSPALLDGTARPSASMPFRSPSTR